MLLSTIFSNIASTENYSQNSELVKSNNILKNLIITMIGNKDFFNFVQATGLEKSEQHRTKSSLDAPLSDELTSSPTETANATKSTDLNISTPIEMDSNTILDYKKLVLVDGTELTLDINFVIRPKDDFLNVDLSTLTYEELLSAVTINLPPSINTDKGGCNKVFKSNQQCKYDKKNDIFIINTTTLTKSIRKSTPEYDEIAASTPEFSEGKKNIIRLVMGKPKNDTRRGVYFLKNSNGQQVSIFPYIEGIVLFDLLDAKNSLVTDEFLRKNNLTKEHIALELALALARLHRLGYMHCDIKPENIIVMNDGTIRFIDPDFFTAINTIITFPQGTLQYYPPYAKTFFEQTKKATPYQDIYSNMICMLLVLDTSFSEFFQIFQKNLNNNPTQHVLDYFKLTLQKQTDSTLSQLFLPFFLNPETAKAEGFIRPLLSLYPKLAEYAINKITKSDQESVSMLTLKLQTFNQNGGCLFIKHKKDFLDYIANLLIQNEPFSKNNFLAKKFLFPDQETIEKAIAHSCKAITPIDDLKQLPGINIVTVIATYLTNDTPAKTKDIIQHYATCYTAGKNNPNAIIGCNVFLKEFSEVFTRKTNSGSYDHATFINSLSALKLFDLNQRPRQLQQAPKKFFIHNATNSKRNRTAYEVTNNNRENHRVNKIIKQENLTDTSIGEEVKQKLVLKR